MYKRTRLYNQMKPSQAKSFVWFSQFLQGLCTSAEITLMEVLEIILKKKNIDKRFFFLIYFFFILAW